MHVPTPCPVAFELRYLVALTRQRVMPLSRWERPISADMRRWIESRGLQIVTVPHRTHAGRSHTGTIFSTSARYLTTYHRAFAGTCLTQTPAAQRLEGFLYGYTACCVIQFIRHPYAPNQLDRADQNRLFHWACPTCRSTPALLPHYRRIHAEMHARYASTGAPVRQQPSRLVTILVATLMAMSVGTTHLIAGDSHRLPLPGDTDGNGLLSAEEGDLGAWHSTQNAAAWGAALVACIEAVFRACSRWLSEGTILLTVTERRNRCITGREGGWRSCSSGWDM